MSGEIVTKHQQEAQIPLSYAHYTRLVDIRRHSAIAVEDSFALDTSHGLRIAQLPNNPKHPTRGSHSEIVLDIKPSEQAKVIEDWTTRIAAKIAVVAAKTYPDNGAFYPSPYYTGETYAKTHPTSAEISLWHSESELLRTLAGRLQEIYSQLPSESKAEPVVSKMIEHYLQTLAARYPAINHNDLLSFAIFFKRAQEVKQEQQSEDVFVGNEK